MSNLRGRRRSTLVIPELDLKVGWKDIDNKIRLFINVSLPSYSIKDRQTKKFYIQEMSGEVNGEI